MALTTDFSISPIFDDHDPAKNYHRILFKPAVALQARELTQLQTILQEQIERFGDNVIREGSIIKGGNFRDMPKIPYVKIMDNNENNQPITIQNYAGSYAVGLNSGVQAYIRATVAGLESQSPDLNTLYIKYTSTGSVGETEYKTFIQGESIRIYNGSETIDIVVAATADVDPEPLGYGWAVSCGDGIIFQKGHFVQFTDQMAIVSKYDTEPNDVVLGFNTTEQIVDYNADTDLLDNAEGYNNHTAPGADRLQLLPVLTVYTVEEAENDEHFLAIQEYNNGQLVKRNTDTQYNRIAEEFEKRTAEESGDYTVNDFNVSVKENSANTSLINILVSPGLGYVSGKRVETVGEMAIPIDKGVDQGEATNQDILGNYGNYIVVENVYGHFMATNSVKVSIRNAAHSYTTNAGATPVGASQGTARVIAFTRHGTTGNRYRLYLSEIVMSTGRTFADSKSVFISSGTGSPAIANIVLEGGKAVIKDASFNSLLFPLGKAAVRAIDVDNSDYITQKATTGDITSSGTFDLSASGDDIFPFGGSSNLNSDQRSEILVTSAADGSQYNITAATTSADAKTLTLTVSPAPASTTPFVATYPVKRMAAKPTGKELGTYYVRLTGDKPVYSLGLPDVFSIEGIYAGANNTFTEASPGITNVTKNFTLSDGQDESRYGLASLAKKGHYKPGASVRLLVKLKAFREVTSGSYSRAYFCINSYPIDDDSVVLPENKIRTEQVPSIKDANGQRLNLRDYIDFRPYPVQTANYAAVPSGASIDPASTENYSNPHAIIAPNKSLELSYTYYIGRIDRVMIDGDGLFSVIRGAPEDNPSPPNIPSIGMEIASLAVPPYPSLPSQQANRAQKPEYGIVVSKIENRRYTMRDIGKIENRISRLEYYTTLNTLEKSAQDMVIVDSDGLDRFKNGIICDNFTNLMVADTRSPAFAASVDRGYEELAPKFRKHDIRLTLHNSTNVAVAGGKIQFPHTLTNIQKQPHATNFRSCTTNFYNWIGDGEIFPKYDEGYDTTRAPDVTMEVDLAGAFADYTDALSEFVPLQTRNSTTRNQRSSNTNTTKRGNVTTTTTNTTNVATTRTKTTELVMGSTNTEQEVGDFVTDVRFSPFMRGNVIRIHVEGLRPNTRFNFFFDGQWVGNLIANARMVGDDIKKMTRTTAFSQHVVKQSNANGILNVMFKLPAGRFYVGDRELVITDVPTLDNIEAATSTAKMMYRAYNYTAEKSGLYLSTEIPTYSTKTTVSTNKETTRSSKSIVTVTRPPVVIPPRPEPEPVDIEDVWNPRSQDRNGGGGGDSGDPIAQTFRVSGGYSQDSHMFIGGVDVFFQKKSAINGVIVEIRNTDTGYPGLQVIPGTRVLLKPNQVSVSQNGSAATQVRFKSPVALKTNTEYAIVVRPVANDPDYRIWVCKTGETDLVSGKKISSDPVSGLLFTSTNNSAWTPYQAENLKYSVYKALFTRSTGTAVLRAEDYEFLSLDSGSTDFQRSEVAFVVNSNDAGTVSFTNGSDVITGSGTAFLSKFAVGDYIAIRYTDGSFEVSKVTAINSATSLVIETDMKATQSGRTYFRTVAGLVDYVNGAYPASLHLRESSAKAGNVFKAGDTVRGELSDAQAVIGEVTDLPISYVQMNMNKVTTSTNSVDVLATLSGPSLANKQFKIAFGDNNYITDARHVFSRSNEIVNYSGARRFTVTTEIKTSIRDTTPIVDVENASMSVYRYFINNPDVATEIVDEGDAEARYLTKQVTLADGMDASDMKLFLTAYRPAGTDINVFIKFKSSDDSTQINEVAWSRLDMVSKTNFRSSLANRDDFKEFEYQIGSTILGDGQGAYLNNGNFEYKGSNGAIYTNFKYFQIKIVLSSVNHNAIPRIKDMRGIALS